MGKVILLVEDEPVIALAEKRRLEEEGFEVLLAVDGEEAVAMALDPSRRLDLILMDIDLGPGIDGTEAARRILAARDLPLLFLSSHVEKDIVARTERISSYGYVVKASSFTVLDASIRMAFKLHAAHRELRERELALEKVTRRFEHLASHGRSFVWEVDLDGLFVYVSPSVEAVTGFTPDEIIGKLHFYDLVPAERREEVRLGALALFEAKEKFSDRVSPALGRDGREIWLSTSGIPIFGPDGVFTGFQGTDADVTRRKQVEDALMASEERYRVLVERAPVAMGIYRHGCFVYVNRAALELLGTDAEEEVVGRSVLAFVHPDSRARIVDLMRRLDHGETNVPIEVSGISLSGEAYDAMIVAVATSFDGEPAGLVIARDISESKRVREEIELHERELRVLTDCIPARVALVNAKELTYRFANKAYVKAFGLTRDLVMGRESAEIMGTEVLNRILPHIEAARRGETSVYEMPLSTPTGEIWNEVTLVPVPDDDGRIDAFVVLGVDITERRRTSRMLAALLEEKNLVLREVHHRLKNNLAVVAAMLEQQADEEGEAGGNAEPLLVAAGRVRSVGLLYDRLYRSQDVRSLRVGDYLPDLVREIMDLFPNDGRILLRTELEDFELPTRLLSPLGIIINEFVTNSYKYAFPAGRGGTIRLTAKARNGRATLIYEDDGVGFSMVPPGAAAGSAVPAEFPRGEAVAAGAGDSALAPGATVAPAGEGERGGAGAFAAGAAPTGRAGQGAAGAVAAAGAIGDGTATRDMIPAAGQGGFGMRLVDILVAQIGGTLSVGGGKGARFTIEFPLS